MILKYWKRIVVQHNFWFGSLLIGMIVTLALVGGAFFPYSPEVTLSRRLGYPEWSHPFGFDLYGRDLLSGCALGAQVSLYIALSTVFISLSVGTCWGCIAGYTGGIIDNMMMRIVDIFMAFPSFLLTLAIASLLGPNLHNVILAIAATGWTSFARVARGEVLAVRRLLYVEASRSIGASHLRLITVHLLPAILAPLLITATFSISGVMIVEASLSFLGLASADHLPTWGRLLSQGRAYIYDAPHLSFIPGILIMFGVLGFNFLGDALRDSVFNSGK
ncbi:MAG: ABC transporter permease [Zetaproteobacteria bacterium]|nr:ABC transporter permease [Zetaproteobacteria bacterium]